MRVRSIRFSEVYHEIQVIELKNLKEVCTRKDLVDDKDCFALTTATIDEDGELHFEILSFGPTYKTCTKGIDVEESLGLLSYEYIKDCEIITSVFAPTGVAKKMKKIFDEENASEERVKLRKSADLDCIRNNRYPDYFAGLYFKDGKPYELYMEAMEYSRRQLKGVLSEEPAVGLNLHYGDQVGFLALSTGDTMELLYSKTLIYLDDSGVPETLAEVLEELIEESENEGKLVA